METDGWMFISIGSVRTLGDVSSSSSSGVGTGSGTDSGGLPTVVVVALVVGVPVVLLLMCGIAYYFKSEGRIRARKEGVVGTVGHHQRHHHHQREIKDLSLTVPCLPRTDHPPPPPTQPPQPPESASIHHRYQQPPPSCMPYSVSLNVANLAWSATTFIFFCYPTVNNAIYGDWNSTIPFSVPNYKRFGFYFNNSCVSE